MFNKTNRLLLAVTASFAFILSTPVAAKDVLDEDFQTWGSITATGTLSAINPKLKWWLEGQGRFGDDTSRFSQSLIRPGVGYALNEKTSVWLGYAWVPTSRPFAAKSPFNEHRIWQQLLWSNQYSFGTITSRTRMEQRFFDIPGSEDVLHRFRQLFKLSVPIPSVLPNLSVAIYDEIFVNLNDIDAGARAGYAVNRVFAGFGYKFDKTVSGEIGYLNQHINLPGTPRRDQMQHILSVSMSLKF